MNLRFLLAGALALLLAACGGAAPRESYYTLAGPAGAPPQASGMSPSVYVGPVAVPDAVDRSPIVLRSGDNQVELSELHRWAEPLKTAIPRVLAETLGRELATRRVASSRQAAGQAVDFRVMVEVTRFDSAPGQGATIDALWTITRTAGGTRTGRSFAQESAGAEVQSIAAAHGRALDRIGREIAAAIRDMARSPG